MALGGAARYTASGVGEAGNAARPDGHVAPDSRLLAVRHGQTLWNALGRIQGTQDAPLTERGLRQARALSALIRRENVTHLRVSPAPRARSTAAIAVAASGRDVPIVVDDLLREMDLGPWQGLTFDEVAQRHPEESACFWSNPAGFGPDGMESFHALFARGRQAALAAAEATPIGRPGGPVMLVTHSLTIKAIALSLLRQSPAVIWSTKEISSETFTELVRVKSRWSVPRMAAPLCTPEPA